MTQHPISPPPELVAAWCRETDDNEPMFPQVAAKAAQWGADQELEACLGEVSFLNSQALADRVRAARRPKPLSLKEQALEALMTADGPDHPTPMLYLRPDAASIIRRALESIPDPAQPEPVPANELVDLAIESNALRLITPIPVSERPILKASDFNDADGRCWCGSGGFIDETGDMPVEMPASWELREPCSQDDWVLPHYALPAPSH